MTNKFLAPDVLQAAVESVGKRARQEQVKIVLVGGYAMQLYGSDRLTGDVDFAAADLIGMKPEARLKFGGIQTRTPNGVPVDLIVRQDKYRALYEIAIETAQPSSRVSTRIARPEFLAVMKFAAARGKDIQDLTWLIVNEKIDLIETSTLAQTFLGGYAQDRFDETVALTLWKKSRGEEP